MLRAPADDAVERDEAEVVAPVQNRMKPDGATLKKFMQDWNLVTIIRGPWGSGKSVACIGKLFMAASLQLPDRTGVRRTRWAVVRNTYPDLQETTIKTWLDWFPEEVYGQMRRSRPFGHILKMPGAPHEGKPTTIEMEVIFLALDDEEDRKKLLSLELTGAWINEAREISKGIIDDLTGRVVMARFPSKRHGGPTWVGVIMDTNAPAEAHWLPMMMGESSIPESISDDERSALVRPANWSYYIQPGALREVKSADGRTVGFEPNPGAENIRYLRDGYGAYMNGIGGKPRTWVRVNFCNLLGQSVTGKPVWPTFDRIRHVAPAVIPFDPARVLYVGVDSTGRNPAALFGQTARARWSVIDELVGSDISSDAFAPLLRKKVSAIAATMGLTFEKIQVVFYRDPHQQKSETDDRTADMVYRKHGIILIPAPGGNAIATRTQTVETLYDNDKITVSPNCRMWIAACDGGYCFAKRRVAGLDSYDEIPDKRNGHADIADAGQYLFLGAGEGRSMMSGPNNRPQPVKVATRYKPRENRDDLWAKRRARANA